jgi:hypothetical protein
MASISLETEPEDPSAIRDITDPIYDPCWWRTNDMDKDLTGIRILGVGFNESVPDVSLHSQFHIDSTID